MKGNYKAIITGEDWGCGITDLIVEFESEVKDVCKDTFHVVETKQVTDFTTPTFDIVVKSFERTVLDSYVCDETGNKVENASKYVHIVLNISPEEGGYYLFSMHTMFNTYSKPYELTITLNQPMGDIKEIELPKEASSIQTNADAFKLAHYKASNGHEYEYAYYQPEVESDTLMVWLHGVGEGGIKDTDPYVTVLANRVTRLIEDEFQNTCNHPHVLVPQCPTFWMDKDGTGKIDGRLILADGTSYYTESLHEMINSYKEKIGAKKVMIAGCSNGGYMTLLLALEYKDEYDVYVPICEAIPDECISDEKLEGIKDLPIYFIYSEDDPTVPPLSHEVPTIKRLKEMGASKLKVFTSEHVVDTSGKYLKDGKPYPYSGHWSWIYFFNNEAHNKGEETVFEWMASNI